MVNKIQLETKKESWENLFRCIRNSEIKSEGNFWATIQNLETQFDEKIKNE